MDESGQQTQKIECHAMNTDFRKSLFHMRMALWRVWLPRTPRRSRQRHLSELKCMSDMSERGCAHIASFQPALNQSKVPPGFFAYCGFSSTAMLQSRSDAMKAPLGAIRKLQTGSQGQPSGNFDNLCLAWPP